MTFRGAPTGGNTAAEGPTTSPATPATESLPSSLPNPTRGITMEQAAARLRARREGTPVEPLPGQSQEQAAPQAPQAPRAESGPPDTGADTGVEDDSWLDADLLPDPPGDAGHGPTEADDPVVFRLRDGTPVTRSEAEKGFLRQQDYTTHRQKQSEVEKALNQELEQTRAARTQYANVLQQQRAELESKTPKLPDPSLEVTNPYEFQAQRTAWLTHQELLRQNQAEQARVYQEHQQDQQRQFYQRASEEAEKALESIPALKHAKTDEERGKILDRLKRTAKAAGYGDQELANLIDHRALRVLDWAARGRAAELAARKGRGNGSAAPNGRQDSGSPTISGATSGTRGGSGTSSARAVDEAEKVFKEKRTMDAAIALRQAKRSHALELRKTQRPPGR